jgi:anti-sigma factor RsiW
MACEHSQLLSPMLDGELSDSQARELRMHVAGCPACRAELDELQALGRLLAAARRSALASSTFVATSDSSASGMSASGMSASGLSGQGGRSPLAVPPDVEQVMARLHGHVQDLLDSTDRAVLRLARIFSGVAACVIIGGLWLFNLQAAAPQQPAAVANKAPAMDIAVILTGATHDGVDTVGAGSSAHASGGPMGFSPAYAPTNIASVEFTGRESVLAELLGYSDTAASGGVNGMPSGEGEMP